MLKDHIASLLKENHDYKPTPGQDKLFDKLSEFINNTNDNQILLIKGYAGTGKTTVVSSLVKTLKKIELKSILLAPTGRAAKVLGSYSKENAYTIHKKIYRQKSSKDGLGEFVLDKNLHTNTFFIVDEASMISNQTYELSIFGSGRLLDDLIEYVYNGKKCKLILLGDTAQLPPVKFDISPALNKQVLQGFGKNVIEVYLTDVIRQSQNSGILFNATNLRNLIRLPVGKTGQMTDDFSKEKILIRLSGFKDISRLTGEDLIEEISNAYAQYGIEKTMIVCRSNKMANKYNQGIRNQILWREEEISVGDYLMVVKNNYYWIKNDDINFIANGDIVEITRIHKYQERYGFRFADVSLRFVDYQDIEIDAKIMLNTLYIETASLTGEDNKKLFYSVLEDNNDVSIKKKRYEMVKDNPFFNALQVKFAYAVTCHKAQGGQWKVVFVDQGFLTDDMLNLEYLRWLYTALTRSTEKLYLVNFGKQFFKENEF